MLYKYFDFPAWLQNRLFQISKITPTPFPAESLFQNHISYISYPFHDARKVKMARRSCFSASEGQYIQNNAI
jgi:hypothetical protein